MRINNNISALNTLNQMNANNNNVARNMERLSSGLRINRAADDAAGLSISENMRAQVRGLERAASNAQDGISMIQTAEGALNEVHSILQRQRELVVQGTNGTNTSADIQAIQSELDALTSEISRIATQTQFNGQNLLDGSAGSVSIQVGANAGQNIEVNFANIQGQALELTANDDTGLDQLDAAISEISAQRSLFGAAQNRLEHTINNLNTSAENLTAAESRIRDTDMAKEMMEMTKNNVLQQAAQAMLAQANQQPQSVLQLLR